MFVSTILGFLSVVLTIAAFIWYLHDTIKKKVRPHILTWLAFGGFTVVTWLIQLRQGEGSGAWALGATWMCCLIICVSSVLRQIREDGGLARAPVADWMWFAISLAIFVFYLSRPRQATLTAVLVTIADVTAYGPTIAQARRDPHRDSFPAFALNSAKFIPAIAALKTYNIATTLYPATLLITNAFVAWLLYKCQSESPAANY